MIRRQHTAFMVEQSPRGIGVLVINLDRQLAMAFGPFLHEKDHGLTALSKFASKLVTLVDVLPRGLGQQLGLVLVELQGLEQIAGIAGVG